jgi:hypothetical protein
MLQTEPDTRVRKLFVKDSDKSCNAYSSTWKYIEACEPISLLGNGMTFRRLL